MENNKPYFNCAVKIFSDKDILTRLFEIYPDQKGSEGSYQDVLKEIRLLKPKRNKTEIVIQEVKDLDGEKYTDVSGLEKGEHVSLVLTDWKEWLGMKISSSSLLHYNYLDIICYCLFEMTFMGYSNDEILEQGKELLKRAKEAKKSIKSSDKKNENKTKKS